MKNKNFINPEALFLVDGSYLLYRSFFAIKPLHTSTGVPTNAVYGFCRALKKLLDTFKPTHLAIVWDSRGGSHRNTIYPSYKAHRPPPPSDLIVQKELIMKFIELVGIPNIALEGYEADDLVATLARKHLAPQTVLVCADKDLYQLLHDPKVLVADLFKDEICDAQVFTERNGFPPEKLSFFHALVGDASDNIPGVKGIGEKGATELVQAFASLDDLYQHLDKVEKKRAQTALTTHEADARLSLELFTLVDAQLTASLEQFAFQAENWNRAADFFRSYEFTSLANTITAPIEPQNRQTAPSLPTQAGWKITIVETLEQVQALAKALSSAPIYSFDTETNGLLSNDPKMEMVGMSFCYEAGEAFYLPFAHPADGKRKNLDRTQTLAILKDTLENAQYRKVLQNAKFDEHVLRRYGVWTKGVVFDTLVAACLIKKNWATINLKDLSLRLLNERMQTYEEVVGKKYKHFGFVPTEDAASYGAHDARQTLLIMPILEKMLHEHTDLESYFYTIDMPIADLLFRMEAAGITLDPAVLNALDERCAQELHQLEGKLTAAIPVQQMSIGEESSFNFNSPRQIEFLLFDILKLPVISKTSKGSRSTDQDVLEKLSEFHFIPALLLKYRELSKLRSTYTQPLPKQIDPVSSRIHTTFSQTLVATGRLSSSDPNLQNIPASADYGHAIRAAFVAAPGHVLLSADYSQIELRILAHITADPALCKAFHEDRDIHRQTAAELLGIHQEAVTPEQRQLGKQLNFSIMYGLTPFGLAQALNIPHKDAKTYIEAYFTLYKAVKDWMDQTVETAKQTGYVASLWGRRRYIPELQEKNRTVFEGGRRAAVNSPIQGTAADLMKIAMLRIDKAITAEGLQSKLLLQIHDEIIIEVPEKEITRIETLVREAMEQAVSWRVPLKVALRAGKNWGEITK